MSTPSPPPTSHMIHEWGRNEGARDDDLVGARRGVDEMTRVGLACVMSDDRVEFIRFLHLFKFVGMRFNQVL